MIQRLRYQCLRYQLVYWKVVETLKSEALELWCHSLRVAWECWPPPHSVLPAAYPPQGLRNFFQPCASHQNHLPHHSPQSNRGN